MMKRVAGFVCSLGLVLALGGTAQAQIYSENFDAIAGTFNGVQYQSGNALAAMRILRVGPRPAPGPFTP